MKKLLATALLIAFPAITGLSAANAGTTITANLPDTSYSQSSSWAGYTAKSFFNGGSWNAGNWGTQWVQVDLLSTKEIDSIGFTLNQLPNGSTWDNIYVSSQAIGGNWANYTPTASRSGYSFNGQHFDFTFAPVAGRYVTIVANGGPSWTSLGNATVTAAVPEPESWAMMLAGLVALGALARRKQKQQ